MLLLFNGGNFTLESVNHCVTVQHSVPSFQSLKGNLNSRADAAAELTRVHGFEYMDADVLINGHDQRLQDHHDNQLQRRRHT